MFGRVKDIPVYTPPRHQQNPSRCLRTSIMLPLVQHTILLSPCRLMRSTNAQPQAIPPRCHQSSQARCSQLSIAMMTSPMRTYTESYQQRRNYILCGESLIRSPGEFTLSPSLSCANVSHTMELRLFVCL
jgi:hypothetical protein